MDGRHGQLRSGVERARPLAGVACPDEIELARGDHPLDELGRLGLDAGLDTRCRSPLALCLPTSPGQDHRFPRPSLRRLPRRRGNRRCVMPSSSAASASTSTVLPRRFPPGRRPAPRPPRLRLFLLIARHAGGDLFLAERGEQVLQPVAVVSQHVLQPTQRQDRLPTEVQEDLRTDLLVRPLEAVVEQTLVDQPDELGAEVGVIDRSLHEGLRAVLGSPAAGPAAACGGRRGSWHR